MKFRPGVWSLLLLLLAVAGADRSFAGDGESAGSQPEPAGRSPVALNLAAQVGEIAGSRRISPAKKERQIATAVRVAVVAATAYKQDANEVLGIALKLSTAAANAAPQYADAIARAAAFAPAVARIDGSAGALRTATLAAARVPKTEDEMTASAGTTVPPGTAPANPVAQNATGRPAGPPGAAVSGPAEDQTAIAEVPSPSDSGTALDLVQKQNTSFYLTAQLGARYDDNIFESHTDKVSDTVITLAPGAEFQYGRDSQSHGSVSYQEAFQHYADHKVANATLGNGKADYGYDGGNLTATAAASFQQLYQTNLDVLGLATRQLTRSDVIGLGGSVESQLTGKLTGHIGTDFSWTNYKTQGLVSNEYTDVPFKLYFKATPKVDLSTGITYAVENPKGGGPTGRDLFYNVGARGSFTPKLSGEFSLGYQTRTVANNPQQDIWGFNGTLNYQLTPKSSSALVFSRQFSTSALGQTLINSHYGLMVSTSVTPRWQAGASLAYLNLDYGPTVFAAGKQS